MESRIKQLREKRGLIQEMLVRISAILKSMKWLTGDYQL